MTQSKDVNERTGALNEDCPVLKLPNELLGHVVEELPAPVFHGSHFDEESYPAFALSHTCKLWREVVMSYPRCWRWIPCANSRWLTEGLRRSQGALLRLHIDVEYHVDSLKSNLALLAEHTSRVESVTVGDHPYGTRPLARKRATFRSSSISAILTLLRYHDFATMRELIMYQWRFEPEVTTLPTLFLDKTPPFLTHIVVSCASLRPGRRPFLSSSLTHFEIVRGSLGTDVDDLIEILKAMPLLEVFIARERDRLTGTSLHRQTVQRTHSVPLRHLRQMTCDGPFEDGLIALGLLSLPLTCSINISNRPPHWGKPFVRYPTNWSTAFDALSDHLSTVPATAMSHPASRIDICQPQDGDTPSVEASLEILYVLETANPEPVSIQVTWYAEKGSRDTTHPSFTSALAPHLFDAAHTLRVESSSSSA
ncbi:unnamed protein product [Peniophora sp. CBMAI 1063]|nr:unnamed protein product [Peniophora sp. CBMAI 1063]